MKLNKIIHVTPSYLPIIGGMEKVVQILTKLQANMGFKVSIITSNPHLDKKNKDTIEVTRLKNFTIANTIVMPKLFFKLLTLNRHDVVHLHIVQSYTPEMVFLASKIKGFKYIAQIHLDVPPSGKMGFLLPFYKKYILKHVLKNASKVVVMTQDHRNLMCKKYNLPKEQVEIIPNATDYKITTIIKQAPHSNLRLLFVGRLSYQKNIPFLLESLAFYAKTYNKNFHLNIVGEGELKKNLEKQISNLKLDKLVTLIGSLKGEALEKIYKDSDILLLSSTHESFGIVLIEAMAKGLPIVSTNILAVKNIIKNNINGFLVRQKITDFATAIYKLTSDKNLYSTISKNNIDDVKNYTWEKSNQKFINTYSSLNNIKKTLNKIKLWYLVLPLLAIANISFLLNNIFGSFITLGFFLLVPGFLTLNILNHEMKSRWKIASFSLGLSLFAIMFGGLLLNTLNLLGLKQPLDTQNTFIMLDIVTLILLAFNKNKVFKLQNFKIKVPSIKQTVVTLLLTFLPFLAAGGAISLNNGGSNIFTMILFGLIPLLFLYLIWQKGLKSLYPYAIIMIGLAVLFSNSLRGWSVTGHDIHHEFNVFQTTFNNSLWAVRTQSGDPYNACLSITILPTILAKITTISAIYIYKLLFQIIFAFGLIPIYFFLKKLSNERKALIGSLLFISFPPFLNDMPFLNRQEIAFVFFGLLMLTTFIKMTQKSKNILTIVFLVGLIFSHYSTNYATLCILLLSYVLFKLISLKKKIKKPINLPAIFNIKIILIAIFFTFLWNSQITRTASGFKNTLINTYSGIINHNLKQANGTTYALFSFKAKDNSKILAEYAGDKADQVKYSPEQNLPITKLGETISKIINVETLNKFIRVFSAKILQILLLIGLIIITIKYSKKTITKNIYLYTLIISFLTLLVLITLLPQLSVDYSVTRLFQQALIIIALPIIIAMGFLLSFLGRFKIYFIAGFFAFLFLHLSGFLPQSLGGYPPQMALNNSGIYYDIYYLHKSEVKAIDWLKKQDLQKPIVADPYARLRFPEYPFFKKNIADPVISNNNSEYLYHDYMNTHKNVYANSLSSNLMEYSYKSTTINGNLLYSNQDNRIYEK